MQPNAFEQFQNSAKLKEQQRFLGKKAHSQIRAFLDGKPSPASGVLDIFVWLVGGGYKHILIGGEVPEGLVNRLERPTVSLEKFFSEYLQYFFRKDYSRAMIENLYVKFTNQMEAEDVKIVYSATAGTLEVDPELLERYAGNRRFAHDGKRIFLREVYDEIKAAEAAEAKSEEKQTPSPAAPTVVPSAPTGNEGGQGITEVDPLSLETEVDEDETVGPVVPAAPDDSGKAAVKPKAKVDEPKKERKVRVPREKKEKA